MVTSIVDFSLSHHGGLLVFSPEDVIALITTSITQENAMTSNASTLLLSLATSLTKIYSNANRPDISLQVTLLMDHLSNTLLPTIHLPKMQHFLPQILDHLMFRPFRLPIISNPEVIFEFFRFISQTMTRYSVTWSQHNVERWMACILVSLGYPEGGLAFQGAADFLVHFPRRQVLIADEFIYLRQQTPFGPRPSRFRLLPRSPLRTDHSGTYLPLISA
jgi:hypothetical protein